jgi:hypothetical protein
MKWLPIVAVAFLIISACASAPAEAEELRIAISPAAQPASAAVLACLPRDESVHISFDALYPTAVELDNVDLYVRLDEPQEQPAFAAQLATETIVIITNAADQLSRSQTADLFSGRVSNWSELGGEDLPVELWVGPTSDEARQAFEASILLSGPVAGDANIATDAQQILDAVAANLGAAGLLPAAWASETAAQIDLGIELPVLAIAAQEPSGSARDVLSCLQGSLGQAALAEKYAPLQP